MLEKQKQDVMTFAGLMGIEKGNQSHINLYVDLLLEEFNEFRKAYRANDQIETRDGLADIWVVATQLDFLNGESRLRSWGDEEELYTGFSSMCHILCGNLFGEINRNDVAILIQWVELTADSKGYSLASDLDEVIKSNLSKFCKDADIMQESIETWRSKGVNVIGKKVKDMYAIYADKGNSSDYPVGKLMKPNHYVKPNLELIK